MHILLSQKISNLDPWFNDIKRNCYSIHDVVEAHGETYVIWSDAQGYSVSHRSYDGKSQGCSGAYETLFQCMQYIYPEFNAMIHACEHAGNSEHHPACEWRKGGMRCSCHVFKCKDAVDGVKNIFSNK